MPDLVGRVCGKPVGARSSPWYGDIDQRTWRCIRGHRPTWPCSPINLECLGLTIYSPSSPATTGLRRERIRSRHSGSPHSTAGTLINEIAHCQRVNRSPSTTARHLRSDAGRCRLSLEVAVPQASVGGSFSPTQHFNPVRAGLLYVATQGSTQPRACTCRGPRDNECPDWRGCQGPAGRISTCSTR